MTLATYGLFRLGWIGVVIVAVAGGLRLYIWFRERNGRSSTVARRALGNVSESWLADNPPNRIMP
jgi:hypothetical protein